MLSLDSFFQHILDSHRPRKWTYFSFLILAASLAWIFVTAAILPITTNGLVPSPHPGFLAPDFVLNTIDGKRVQLSDLRGKPVLINIWASWCPPCKAEMPALQAIHDAYQSKGLVILGINSTSQDTLPAAKDFARSENLTFPILLDTEGKIVDLFQVQALPSSFFIGPDGLIKDIVIGGPMPDSLIRSKIQLLFTKDP